LSDDLAAQLGTIDVVNSAYPAGVRVYRVSVNVQRFESWPGQRAALDAVWSVRAIGSQAVMTCRTSVAEPVAGGYDALVVGHRRAIGALAGRIAAGVRAMEESHALGAATASPSRTAATGISSGKSPAPVWPCRNR
ncbi:PqiC family protein, partial [Burkholderia ubonensis]